MGQGKQARVKNADLRFYITTVHNCVKSVMFLRKYADKKCSCGHNILTEGVFVTELSGDADPSFTSCVGCDKLLYREGCDYI